MEKKKYFLALIPEGDIYEKALEWKQYFAREFNSKAALRSPPHITLHMPFLFREDREELLCQNLSKVAKAHALFQVLINGFGAFPPRVIFWRIENNPVMEALHHDLSSHLHKTFNIDNARYRDRPFRPHLTLAFRDLKKQDFPEAWARVENISYSAQFTAGSIALLRHTGKIWEVHRKISMLNP